MGAQNDYDFSELYQKYAPMVLRRCRAILKDEEKALDAMQDVFLRVMENKKKIKHAGPDREEPYNEQKNQTDRRKRSAG